MGAILGSDAGAGSAGRRRSRGPILATTAGTRRRQGSVASLDDSTAVGGGASGGAAEERLCDCPGPHAGRYLAACLAKLTSPINQMFPELEGYCGRAEQTGRTGAAQGSDPS